jgi:hypothetical protein
MENIRIVHGLLGGLNETTIATMRSWRFHSALKGIDFFGYPSYQDLAPINAVLQLVGRWFGFQRNTEIIYISFDRGLNFIVAFRKTVASDGGDNRIFSLWQAEERKVSALVENRCLPIQRPLRTDNDSHSLGNGLLPSLRSTFPSRR